MAAVVTDEIRVKAELVVAAFWLRHVITIADKARETGQCVTMYPPSRAEVECAAERLAQLEPQTDVKLAVPSPRGPEAR